MWWGWSTISSTEWMAGSVESVRDSRGFGSRPATNEVSVTRQSQESIPTSSVFPLTRSRFPFPHSREVSESRARGVKKR